MNGSIRRRLTACVAWAVLLAAGWATVSGAARRPGTIADPFAAGRQRIPTPSDSDARSQGHSSRAVAGPAGSEAAAGGRPTTFRSAAPGYLWRFPRDMGSHPGYRTEWWYYTGHLHGRRGETFGYELTIFRQGLTPAQAPRRSAWATSDLYLAHFTVTDPAGHRFRYDERAERGALGLAGAATDHQDTWCERWRARVEGPVHHLSAAGADYRIDLTATALKPPALHGLHGYSQKGSGPEHAPEYYSLTRMATAGILWKAGRPMKVVGTTWMDHEFSSGSLAPDEVGWDWFSLQLDTGEEVMLYRLRRIDRSADPHSGGTWVGTDGTTCVLHVKDYMVDPQARWTSPHTGTTYPSRWRVRVADPALDVDLVPLMPDQELVTSRSTGVTYWEGAVSVHGTLRGKPVHGEGYVELTGYVPKSTGKDRQ